jgi:hydroxymethylglutaryl-CoA reductase
MESRLPDFHKLNASQQLDCLVTTGWIEKNELSAIGQTLQSAESRRLSENVIGSLVLPLGVVTNVLVNGIPRLVPMSTEEPSVVAGCSRAALLSRAGGGVVAAAGKRYIAAQVLVSSTLGDSRMRTLLEPLVSPFRSAMDRRHPRVAAAGGGLDEITFRTLEGGERGLGVFDIVAHPGDSMGANYVNDIAEQFSDVLSEVLSGRILGAIVSNAPGPADATARVAIPFPALARTGLPGEEVALRIELLSNWATLDKRRTVTHIKGILNGMCGVMTALYQDTRALSCALWMAATRTTPLDPIVRWHRDDGCLTGRFSGPIVCGVAGGTGSVVPAVGIFHRWLKVTTAGELEAVVAAVGLLQNLAALQSIAAEGISRGHMKLHRRKLEG